MGRSHCQPAQHLHNTQLLRPNSARQTETLQVFVFLIQKESWFVVFSFKRRGACRHATSSQLGLTLCDPMNCSPPGFLLSMGFSRQEWVATPSSRRSSQIRDRTHVSLCFLHWQGGSLPLVPPAQKMWVVNPKMAPSPPPVTHASRYSCPCNYFYFTSELVYLMNWPQEVMECHFWG